MKLSCQSFKSCTKKQEVGNDQFKRLCSKSTICKKKSKSLKHVIKGLCDFIEGSSSTTLPDLVTIRYCGSGDKMFLIYHVNSGDHRFRGLRDRMGLSFL